MVAKLAAKVKQGGSGNWGAVPMSPHPDLTDLRLKAMVEWILSQSGRATAQAAPATLYPYTLADGTTAKLDFPLFVEGQQPKVTKAVFHGYEMFDSYCYRCHGQDATGSEIAPDLRNSLKMGMTVAFGIIWRSVSELYGVRSLTCENWAKCLRKLGSLRCHGFG
jgi:cytochrome c